MFKNQQTISNYSGQGEEELGVICIAVKLDAEMVEDGTQGEEMSNKKKSPELSPGEHQEGRGRSENRKFLIEWNECSWRGENTNGRKSLVEDGGRDDVKGRTQINTDEKEKETKLSSEEEVVGYFNQWQNPDWNFFNI